MKNEKKGKLPWAIFPPVAVILLGIFAGMMLKEKPETSQKESDTPEGADAIQAVAQTKSGKYADTSSYEELDELYKDYFILGTGCEAIDHWNNQLAEIGNPDKEALISRMYNSITFGNEFKPAYNFDASSETLFTVNFAAEELLNWAKENGVGVRGHTLVWHGQINPSIFAKDFKAYSNGKLTVSDTDVLDEDCLVSREVLLERLKTYIYGVLKYTYQNGYADIIYAWDVVNEACDESQPDGLRRSYWYQIIGPDYLYYCFLYAREAVVQYSNQYASLYGLNPETDDLSPIQPKLFYNDYNEWVAGRSNAIVHFLTEEPWNENHEKVTSPVIRPHGDGTIYGDGLIDGIGMQGHLDDTQNIEQYMTALEKYNAAVGEVHITELDVGCTKTDANAEFYQAKFYYEFFTRLIEEVKSGVNLTSVTLWGLTDDASWRKDVKPLLFNGDLSRKPAFEALVMAAKGEEFSLTALKIAVDAKDMHVTFEPYKEGGKTKTVTPQSAGIYSRGTGHQSAINIVNTENHTKNATIGFALRVRRSEKDASMKMDLSSFIGRTIKITAFVKTQDKKIFMGLDTTTSQQLAEENASDDWVEVSATCSIPKELNSASLYFETDGNADFYIDDIDITVISQDGEMTKAQDE
ncbi:MAG: Beta-xylanase [Lachnoclostridium sp.]|jgi:GH35 family endo-1,4-beta-xylanase